MKDLTRTETVETYEDLCCTLCWDDDEDPATELAAGVYPTCAGEWRREPDGRWRWWENSTIVSELTAAPPERDMEAGR